MKIRGVMASMPRKFRLFVICFVLILNVGFFTGFSFVRVTTSLNSQGIEQNYLGNEDDENAEVMHFKKSEREILTLIHNHVLSLSLIFFILGILLYMCKVPDRLVSILMFEPFLSLLLTFGGIYILWKGVIWFKYVIMASGFAMVLSLILMSTLVIKCCLHPEKEVV
ncbi:hypothetical protein LCM02_02135 [Lutimonas saemankumensis]|uniref:hypothetical protein n=1 Tax=Lutimonas saemankumensis TaxID=483016 RepID=UPI001CD2E3BF|nr:hypothetical protein [Lutimonas saemankumensis]MCA0931232.1 hypothetical protein [Lutimonas saemankumensis]